MSGAQKAMHYSESGSYVLKQVPGQLVVMIYVLCGKCLPLVNSEPNFILCMKRQNIVCANQQMFQSLLQMSDVGLMNNESNRYIYIRLYHNIPPDHRAPSLLRLVDPQFILSTLTQTLESHPMKASRTTILYDGLVQVNQRHEH